MLYRENGQFKISYAEDQQILPIVQDRWFMAAAALLGGGIGCTPREGEPAATPLPTRQSTIDPVKQKLDAAQQEAERRRNEAERAGQ